MATACITHSALKVHGISKPIIARFDQPQASSDGGAILIKAVDDRLGLTWRVGPRPRPSRPAREITPPLPDSLRTRPLPPARGYAPLYDAAPLGHEPTPQLPPARAPTP